METRLELSCDELKKQVITAIENADCDEELLQEIKNSWNIWFNDPILPRIYDEAKQLFKDECSKAGIKIRDSFIISKVWFNKIIGDNWDKEFMHIFFIDNNNDLDIVFRFSDTENFKSTIGNDIELDLNSESAYSLKNGQAIQFDRTSPDFSTLTSNYKEGVGEKISSIQNSTLTEYITYNMKKIFLFNGFEHDVTLELICIVDDKKKYRLTLCAYIHDKNRIHHINSVGARIYDGYYDLGNLKP
ncbi:hypothetical protein [Chryseobacterium sp. c4a]|uniref:hypothetical protein n=1 Tax=Chryseobacterium sp. c4a TaxID=1573582 RepID=UPI001357BE68|nr:hypothetical protein [Chryseobacterium sp. c4a]